ncbi:hypothetical protein ACFL6I_13840 [candidate division KSB1 bacterium]
MVNIVEKVDDLVKVRTALMSTYDKRGLDTFVPELLEINPELLILSTGGTHGVIEGIINDSGVGDVKKNLKQVAVYTGQPETQGGLVKTLDFKIYLGLLTETYNVSHQNDLKRTESIPIDLVAVNLYPFNEVVAKPDCTPEKARANIDIGGPTMIRAGAKNFHRVAVSVSPLDYQMIIDDMKAKQGCTKLFTRYLLMHKAFNHTAQYDSKIKDHFGKLAFGDVKESYRTIIARGE